jgi:isopenicillin-N N-acyltransferase like protein
MRRNKVFRFILFFLLIIIIIIGSFIAYIELALRPSPPTPESIIALQLEREELNPDFFKIENNWLRKSESGLWEVYIEGKPFERGVILGKLEKELLVKQEESFVEQIRKLIPSEFYLKFLKYFIAFFNRNLAENVPEENLLEIYGISLSAPHEFDFIGTGYERMLNYHAAHDIGHAMQNLALVGCTSFAAWDSRSEDSSLIIGRNFDFYVGDKFAEDKIVQFSKPENGHGFMMITWAGMTGVVSGMNEQGLTVTLNAAKSDVPSGSAMPISILAREILQYASNIDEAYSIAKKRKTFVAESILIGSAKDNKAAIIEKSVNQIALYQQQNDFLVCSNHYQSDAYKNDANNVAHINESASLYRHERVLELLNENQKLNYTNAAAILRDQRGHNNMNIGMGNEKAINQLIAHHSIIFKPQQLLVWISTQPYQLGKYVCYDLRKVLDSMPGLQTNVEIHEAQFTIAADTFLQTGNYAQFVAYKKMENEIRFSGKNKVTQQTLKQFAASNPDYFFTYTVLGDYYRRHGNCEKATTYYKAGLTKIINTKQEEDYLKEKIAKCIKK